MQSLLSNYDFVVDEDIVLKNNYQISDDDAEDDSFRRESEYQSPPAYFEDDDYYDESNTIKDLKEHVYHLEDEIRSLSQKIKESDNTIQDLVSVRLFAII